MNEAESQEIRLRLCEEVSAEQSSAHDEAIQNPERSDCYSVWIAAG